jgi:O-antigen ligase
MALAWVSLLISILQYTLNRKLKFLTVGPMLKPLVFLVAVTLITARCRGGIGLQILGGSNVGGRGYITLLTAIAAFFAITARRIPPERALFFVGLFFAGQATIALSELSEVVGPSMHFIFLFFPPTGTGVPSSLSDQTGSGGMARLGCLATACAAIIWFMLARFGIDEIFTWRRLGRLGIFLTLLCISMLGGFRSILLFFLLTFGILFYLEGLMRRPLLPALLLVALLGGTILIPFVGHLPLSVQRTLSFLPLQVDPVAQASADLSTEWRLQMWKRVLPQIPQYFWLGKGYGINAADLAMASNAAMEDGTFGTEIAGDYHNGPLSLIIPFGIFGVIGFVWFLAAGLKVLRQNYYYGDPAFAYINRFLLSMFIAKAIFFFTVFGGFSNDLAFFVGLVGLSICVNGGVAEPVRAPQPKVVYNRFKLSPGMRKPVGA